MNIRDNVVLKSLLIFVMAVIFLCASAGVGIFKSLGNSEKPATVYAEENPVYAAYIKKGGNSALYQLPDKQQSSVYVGKYNSVPIKWTILQNGTLNNSMGTMLCMSDKNLTAQHYYQYYNMSNSGAYGYNTWATSHVRAFLNGTAYAKGPSSLEQWNGNPLVNRIFGTSGTLRNTLLETYNSTMIYYDNDTYFTGNGSHLNSTYISTVHDNYDITKASFEEIFEYTYDYLFLLGAHDITAANGFTFMDEDGNLSPQDIVTTINVNRNHIYVAHADGVKVGSMDLRNSVKRGMSAASRMIINSDNIFDSVTTNPMTNYQFAFNINHNDFIFAISGLPESGWVNGTVTSVSGERPSYKLFLKDSSEIGSVAGIFPTDAYVLNGKLNIDLSHADGNNYIDKYMVVIKDASQNVVSSRGVSLADYQGASALQLDSSVLDGDILKDNYTVEVFGYKSTSGNELTYCTQKAAVSVQNKREVTLTIDNLSLENEVESRIYGDDYNPITATAVETVTGIEISDYEYIIQYNDEDLSGEWTSTVPVDAGRYAVRAYGAATDFYMEAVSDVAYLVINPRTLQINFIDEYKISNTEGGTRPYNGQQYIIRAEFTNVVAGDSLIPITGGGKAVNASDTPYLFIVYGFSAGNSTIRANYYMRNVSYPYTITRKDVTVNWSDTSFIYDATAHKPTAEWTDSIALKTGSELVVSGEQVNASDTPYTATVEITGDDATNFNITNNTQDFTIAKATATIVWSDLTATYDGTQKNPSVAWENAEVLPVGTPAVIFEERINAGNYAVTATYDGDDVDNFTIVNVTETMTIERAKLWISLSGRASYGQEAILSPMINTGMSDPILSDDMTDINAALATVMLETNWTPSSPMGQAYYVIVAGYNQTVYHDYNLLPNYDFEFHRATFYPTKAMINSIEWSENDYTYNGTVQTITATGDTGYGQVIVLEITVDSEFKNAAANYIATASISESNATNFDFAYGVAKTRGYEIKKATATVVWSDLTATYDGTQKNPSVTWESAAVVPESAPEVIASERINAGAYTVTAEYNGADKDNFTIENGTETMAINPRELVISWVDANGGSREYDGTEYEVGATFTDLVSGDTVIAVITGESGINASETPYTKTVTGFTVEGSTIAGNYVLPSTGCDYTYTITKRNITVSWSNTELTYTATAQKPTATWTDSVALNTGSEIVVSGEQVNASDTAYTATVTITGADVSNFTITNDTQEFTIGKREVFIQWLDTNFVYDGTQKHPTATWAEGEVLPIGNVVVNYGEMIQVDNYSITATYNGADKENFTGTYSATVVQINRVKLYIDLTGYANYGQEAVLSYSIDEINSNPIPESETDTVYATLNGVALETDWTPTSAVGGSYYVIVAGHNQDFYVDITLMPNYELQWFRGFFTAGVSEIITIEWVENDYTYNGMVQTITAQGKTANNVVIDLEITVNKEFKNVANDYVAAAAIKSEDESNFIFASGVVTTNGYEIKKATVAVIWSNLTVTYDGAQQNPSVTWESAVVTPNSVPEVIASERINAGSYTVISEYNGTDKDNFTILNVTEAFVIIRANIEVNVTLAESSIIFGSEMQAHADAGWLVLSEQSNNALLESLITGYAAGDNVGSYTITLDFEKAEDESRRSPETFLDNYIITNINGATLTVNRKTITASDIDGWINSGDILFKGKTVLEDGNVHMIYATVSGEAADFIKVSEYVDKNGATFTGASVASNYYVTAVFIAADDNYEVDGTTLTALLRISAKVAIIDKNGNERGYIIGLDPEHDYNAELTESESNGNYENVNGNGVETKIVITDENGNIVDAEELIIVLTPPSGYNPETDSLYLVSGGTAQEVATSDYTVDGEGNLSLLSDTDNGTITFVFGGTSDLGSGGTEASDIYTWFFWIVVIGATIFGLIAILTIIKKFCDEYAGK